jgi:hypothetical protein
LSAQDPFILEYVSGSFSAGLRAPDWKIGNQHNYMSEHHNVCCIGYIMSRTRKGHKGFELGAYLEIQLIGDLYSVYQNISCKQILLRILLAALINVVCMYSKYMGVC